MKLVSRLAEKFFNQEKDPPRGVNRIDFNKGYNAATADMGSLVEQLDQLLTDANQELLHNFGLFIKQKVGTALHDEMEFFRFTADAANEMPSMESMYSAHYMKPIRVCFDLCTKHMNNEILLNNRKAYRQICDAVGKRI